jgi:hypothetical protein
MSKQDLFEIFCCFITVAMWSLMLAVLLNS